MGDCLYLVVPTCNEEINIRAVVEVRCPMLVHGSEGSRLVVLDGGSWDKTLEILYSLQRQYGKLIVVPKPGTDHSIKVILLYRYIIVYGVDRIFQANSDGQTVPAELAAFRKLREEYDVIMSDRRKCGDGMGRKVVENVLHVCLRIFFGTFVPDVNASFRLMKSSVVAKYLDLMPADFNLSNAILAVCFSKHHGRACCRVVTFQPRQDEENYMNAKHIFKIGLQSIRNFAEVRKRMDAFDRRNRRNI